MRVAAALVDHLWQSILVLVVLALAAAVSRGGAATFRVWLWRIAALKFVVPFGALFVVGGWLGFPIRYPEDTVPGALTSLMGALAPYVTPVQARRVDGWALAACALPLLTALIPCARWVRERLRAEEFTAARERERAALDPDDVAPGLGFVRAFVFTVVAMLVLAAPVVAGAVDDRLARHAQLLVDARALRDADVSMTPAAPGMGQRARLVARRDGVFIRNASIQELAGFAYGVNRTFVWGDHFNQRGELDWLVDARYDVRIPGRIRDPDRFDSYALRVPITRMLALKHGLELYVNDKCQPPCGRYAVAIPEEER